MLLVLAITLGGPGVHNKAAEDFCESQCGMMERDALTANPNFKAYSNLTCEVRDATDGSKNPAGTVECVLTGTKNLIVGYGVPVSN